MATKKRSGSVRSVIRGAGRLFSFLVLIFWALVNLLPLYWLFLTASKPSLLITKMPPELWPRQVTLGNFQRLFARAPILRWLLNSSVVSLTVTAGTVILSSMAGYAFAKRKFYGHKALFWLVIGTMMLPPQVTLVPVFVMLSNLGLVDRPLGIILPSLASGFGIFLMRQYMTTLPGDLEDAARLDGCSEMGIYRRIILPLSKPVVAALSIFTFMNSWNAFLFPLIVLQSTSKYTLTVGLATLQHQELLDYGLVMAGAALAALPMMAMFFAFQKHFMRGLIVGSLKG